MNSFHALSRGKNDGMRIVWLAPGLILFGVACGSDDSGGGASGGSGGHVDAGTGGSAASGGSGGSSGSGGAAGSAGSGGAAGSAGSGGAAGSAGSGGAAGSAGSGGAAGNAGAAGSAGQGPACASVGSGIAATLAGTTLLESWPIASIGAPSKTPFHVAYEYAARGYAELHSTIDGDPLSPTLSSYPIDWGFLLAPTTSALGGRVACLNGGSYDLVSSGRAFTTQHAKLLAACSGAATGQDISFCQGTCANHIAGTLDGKTPSSVGMGAYTVAMPVPDAAIQFSTSELVLRVFTDQAIAAGTTGNVALGVIFTQPTSQFGGAIYCAGPGSTYQYQVGTSLISVSLKNVEAIGTCTSGDGSDAVTLCL